VSDGFFFDEFTFKKFYKNIMNKYENNLNDFSSKDALNGTIEIVDEHLFKIYDELIEILEKKEKEILELKNENDKLKFELENKKNENNKK